MPLPARAPILKRWSTRKLLNVITNKFSALPGVSRPAFFIPAKLEDNNMTMAAEPSYLEWTMATLNFTPNLLRHVSTPTAHIEGATVRQVLENYFQVNPQVRTYVLDDQGNVRRHVTIFVNAEVIRDRQSLSDRVNENDEVFVMQALSGG